MSTEAIIALIDKELARLHEVRRLMANEGKRILSKGSAAAGRKRPRLSAAARGRIAEAQRKRWAAARKKAKG